MSLCLSTNEQHRRAGVPTCKHRRTTALWAAVCHLSRRSRSNRMEARQCGRMGDWPLSKYDQYDPYCCSSLCRSTMVQSMPLRCRGYGPYSGTRTSIIEIGDVQRADLSACQPVSPVNIVARCAHSRSTLRRGSKHLWCRHIRTLETPNEYLCAHPRPRMVDVVETPSAMRSGRSGRWRRRGPERGNKVVPVEFVRAEKARRKMLCYCRYCRHCRHTRCRASVIMMNTLCQ